MLSSQNISVRAALFAVCVGVGHSGSALPGWRPEDLNLRFDGSEMMRLFRQARHFRRENAANRRDDLKTKVPDIPIGLGANMSSECANIAGGDNSASRASAALVNR